MSDRYDVAVVGAGLGGLGAAAALARAGLSVCLLEKHNIPGGYATSFVRGRFEFEVALHELSGIGTEDRPAPLSNFLRHVGVAQRVEFVRVPEVYRCILPGDLDITLPVGTEAYEQTLCEAFPGEAKGIHRFLERVFTLEREVRHLVRHEKTNKPWQLPFRYPHLLRYLTANWGEVLNRDIKDVRCRAALSQYWGYFGLGPANVSFMLFAMALTAYLKLGPAYVKGRSQALSNAFVDAFESNGGVVHFNTTVQRILTANGQVTGVETDEGRRIEARYVVSNADPIATCQRLLNPDDIPSSFFRDLGGSTVAPASTNVYLGLNAPPEVLGDLVHENFVNDGPDFDAHEARVRGLEHPGMTLVTCYNSVWPEISPPGTTQLVLTTLQDGEPWANLPPERYLEQKQRVADVMIKDAERLAPDLRRYAEVVEVATPITNMRYSGAIGGTIYGFNNPGWDHTVLRMSPKGPVRNLFFAGAFTQLGGGMEPAMDSGRQAAGHILRRERRQQEA